MDIQQEEILIELCKTDLSHFTTLYDEYAHDVYRYSCSISREKESAQDAVSFAFLKALEKINDYQFQGKSIKAWLFVIARNFIYQSFSKNVSLESEEDWAGQDESILDQMIDEERSIQVRKVMDTLMDEEKEIIRLKLWDEMKFEEIADVMGINISGAKMRYYRAVDKMRQKLTDPPII